ncbi:hypothetical protein SAMN05216567_106281 [Variovorax sp. OK605]|nr:hypothetical protein SAMN05216567_106281 [Variovorax sp. OK605]
MGLPLLLDRLASLACFLGADEQKQCGPLKPHAVIAVPQNRRALFPAPCSNLNDHALMIEHCHSSHSAALLLDQLRYGFRFKLFDHPDLQIQTPKENRTALLQALSGCRTVVRLGVRSVADLARAINGAGCTAATRGLADFSPMCLRQVMRTYRGSAYAGRGAVLGVTSTVQTPSIHDAHARTTKIVCYFEGAPAKTHAGIAPHGGALINILCRAEPAESRASRRRLYLLGHCLFNAVAQPHDRLPTRFELASYGGH